MTVAPFIFALTPQPVQLGETRKRGTIENDYMAMTKLMCMHILVLQIYGLVVRTPFICVCINSLSLLKFRLKE